MRSKNEMQETERKASVSKGANVCLWLGFSAMAGFFLIFKYPK